MSQTEHSVELIQKLSETGLAELPGKLLYSGLETLRPGPLYLLGYNPGGEPDHETSPIRSHVLDSRSASWNEYLDASWRTRTYHYSPGMAPLQKRVHFLLKGVGADTRSVCASNLIFVRSKNEKRLESSRQKAEKCWPVHEFIMEIVRPKGVITFGQKAWDFIISRAIPKSSVELVASGHGDWICSFAQISLRGRKLNLVGVPHLSRYAIDCHPEVVSWVATKLAVDVSSQLESG